MILRSAKKSIPLSTGLQYAIEREVEEELTAQSSFHRLLKRFRINEALPKDTSR
jgi:uncharacterized protein YjbK